MFSDRLVETRTVLERIRPLEYKLKYMMEKLVKAALTGVTDESNPTQFRANPHNMVDNVRPNNYCLLQMFIKLQLTLNFTSVHVDLNKLNYLVITT